TGGGATVGTATRKIISATVVGGCNGGLAAICSNSSFSKVYADAYSSAPSSLTKPPLYLQDTYDSADCTHPVCSSCSSTFHSNNNMTTSPLAIALSPASSYDCRVKDASGTVVGRLAWNASTSVLTISGIIFLDGPLLINSNTHATYT